MEESTRDIGKKTNNMKKVIITLRKEKWEEDSGKTDKEKRK